MRAVIITGATGFIGSALVEEMIENGYFVYAVVRSMENVRFNTTENRVKIVKTTLDKLSQIDVGNDHEVECFYHLAWQGSSGSMRADVELQLSNVMWTVEAVKCAKRNGANRFVGAGSLMEAEVLQSIEAKNKIPQTTYVYGMAKLNAHHMSRAMAGELGIEHIWTHLSAIGVYDNPKRFIKSILEKMRNNSEIDFTEADQWYDFSYVTDTALAMRLLAEKGENNESYYIGSGNPQKLKDFIILMKEISYSKSILNFGAYQHQSIKLPFDFFSIKRLEECTGFKAKVSFEEGIKEILESDF